MKPFFLSLTALVSVSAHGALISTWIAPQDAGSLGDAGAASVLLSPNSAGASIEFTSAVSSGTNFTDVVILSTTQQSQLSGAGLSVVQGLNNVRGATRRLTGPSFEALGNAGGGPPNLTNRNATIDLYFSPDNLNDASQLIFESGGSGAGTSLNMNGNVMTVGVAQNALTAVTASIDLDPIYAATPNTDDMLHVRISYDLANDKVVLSALNLATGLGTLGSTAYAGTDWNGSDPTGFFNLQGTVGGSAGGNVPVNYSNFDGQFAGFQIYGSEVLAPVPEPSASLTMVLACLGAVGFRRRA